MFKVPFETTPWYRKDVDILKPLDNGLFIKPFRELKWLKIDSLENELKMHAMAKKILPDNVPGVVGIYKKDEEEWYYIQEAVVDAMTINEYFVENFTDMGILVEQIRELIATLNRSGLNHNDLHGGNVLVDKNKKVWLIDFGMSSLSSERETNLEIAVRRPKKKVEFYNVDLSEAGVQTMQTSEKCSHPHLSYYHRTGKRVKMYKYLHKMNTDKSRKLADKIKI